MFEIGTTFVTKFVFYGILVSTVWAGEKEPDATTTAKLGSLRTLKLTLRTFHSFSIKTNLLKRAQHENLH